jgi:hypothetical protein
MRLEHHQKALIIRFIPNIELGCLSAHPQRPDRRQGVAGSAVEAGNGARQRPGTEDR